MIHAWLDGELGVEEAERVARLAAEDPEWAAAVAEARGLVAASSRIVSALDVIPGGVVPAGTRAAGSPAGSRSAAKPRYMVRPWMRMAAGVVLVVGTATVVWTRTANAPQLDELRSVATSQPTQGPVPSPLATADEAGARQEVAATTVAAAATAAAPAAPPAPPERDAANQVKKSAANDAVARQALLDSTARLNSAVAGAGVAAQSSAREADALKRAESERAVAGGRLAVNEPTGTTPTKAAAPASAPAAPALAPAAKATAEFRARRADQPAEVGAVGRATGGVAAAGVAQRDAASVTAAGSADVAAQTVLAGCWMATTTGRPDSLLTAPRITRQAGDTLVLAVAADGRTATVRRAGADAVRGETRFGEAKAVVFVATRVACPRAP
jgi:hypothetical protein